MYIVSGKKLFSLFGKNIVANNMVYQKFNKIKIADNNIAYFELGKFFSLDNTKALSKTYLWHNILVAYYTHAN